MTDAQKREIANLRVKGNGYGKIALALGISQNTVKSYCRRNNIVAGSVSAVEAVEPLETGTSFCECCGKEIHQVFGHKTKRFCSDACRNKWWNSHLDLVKRRAVYKYKCPGCGREFEVYGNSRRKYCSHTGNMLLQKEYIADPISKQRRKNHGELPQYYVEDTHPAIIDKATFDYVQEEMARRRELGCFANKSLNLSCFSTKIKCGNCGRSFLRSARKRGSYVIWTCGSKKGRGKSCGARDIPEKLLQSVCAEVLCTGEFDDLAFAERIESVIIIGKDTMEFHLPTAGSSDWIKGLTVRL